MLNKDKREYNNELKQFIKQHITEYLEEGYKLSDLRKVAINRGSKVYIPTYNNEEYLEQRVNDILSKGDYIYTALNNELLDVLDEELRNNVLEHISNSVRNGTDSYYEELDKAQEMLDVVNLVLY